MRQSFFYWLFLLIDGSICAINSIRYSKEYFYKGAFFKGPPLIPRPYGGELYFI